MEFVWISLGAIFVVLAVASILYEKFCEKTLFDKYYLHDPKFEGEFWEISEVRCIEGFLRFVLSHANENDYVIIEGFNNDAPVEHAGKLKDSIFHGNLALSLNEENKAKFMAMVEELMRCSDTDTAGTTVRGNETTEHGKLPNRNSAIWEIVDNIFITNEDGWLMVSYDWLTCCRLSGRISESEIEKASAKGVLVYSNGLPGGTT